MLSSQMLSSHMLVTHCCSLVQTMAAQFDTMYMALPRFKFNSCALYYYPGE